MKKKLIIIAGPTAIGKSSVAVDLCKEFNGAVVGAESMQIYKGMGIGTGKITAEEMDGIKHFMLDITSPGDYFTVFDYVQKAKICIDKILKSSELPFVVGGTGLYISGLLSGNNFAEAAKNNDVRADLENITQEKGLEFMYNYLQTVDPQSALKISKNDKKRILRALEIYIVTGKPKSQSATSSNECDYDYLFFVIIPSNREALYKDIENRVDRMISDGLVKEVESLLQYKDCNSMQAIGYKEIVEHLEGKTTLTEAIAKIKINSRHYAKRQLTYFRNMPFEKIFVEKNNDLYRVVSDIIREKYE